MRGDCKVSIFIILSFNSTSLSSFYFFIGFFQLAIYNYLLTFSTILKLLVWLIVNVICGSQKSAKEVFMELQGTSLLTNPEFYIEQMVSHGGLEEEDLLTVLSTCKVWRKEHFYLVQRFFYEPKWNSLQDKIFKILNSSNADAGSKFDAKMKKLGENEKCIDLKHLSVILLRKLSLMAIALDDNSLEIVYELPLLKKELCLHEYGEKLLFASGLKTKLFKLQSNSLSLSKKIDFYVFNTCLGLGMDGDNFFSFMFDHLIEQLPHENAVNKLDEIGRLLLDRTGCFGHMVQKLISKNKYDEAQALLPLIDDCSLNEDLKNLLKLMLAVNNRHEICKCSDRSFRK